MDEIRAETGAFVLMATSLPLISYGGFSGVDPAWMLGFGLLVVATVIPPAMRYVGEPAVT